MISLLLMVAAAVGLLALLIQRLAVTWHLSRPVATPRVRPGISILKPLCGLDEGLEENLVAFAQLEYPRYELLLGVKNTLDDAWPLACELAVRFPSRVRVVLQQSAPGLNPKVNQLSTLEHRARYELLWVSDSNTRPPVGGLTELAAHFADPAVACVSHPVSGTGQQSLGALLDNLHLASAVGAGQVGAKVVAGQDLVVGKSMALRRSALEALGGFGAFADVLAEDYVIGQALRARGLRSVIAHCPVLNLAVHRTVGSFWRRYARWSVIHRTAVSPGTSLAQALLNPWPLTVVALALSPSRLTALVCLTTLVLKAVLDVSSASALGCRPPPLTALLAVPLKDALLFAAWARALLVRTVDWRGTQLRVEAGSRLVPLIPPLGHTQPAPAEVTP